MIDSKTGLYGLIGHPVGHSVSPALQNALMDLYGINGVYLAFDIEEDDLEDTLIGGEVMGVKGFNVTVPYKQAVIPFMTSLSVEAERLSAVNTLKLTEEGYVGYNTDMPGLMRAFKYDGVELKDREVVLLGAGGAAAAALAAVLESGAGHVVIVNRTKLKAEQLKNRFGRFYEKCRIECVSAAAEAVSLMKAGGRGWMALQSTSVGMFPDVGSVVTDNEEFYSLTDTGYDIIFNPEETLFMKKVRAAGGAAFNGLRMLLFQGMRSFEIWNGIETDDTHVEKLLKIMEEALKRR